MKVNTGNLEVRAPRNFIRWTENLIGSRRFAICLVMASAVSGLATYVALTGAISPEGADPPSALSTPLT